MPLSDFTVDFEELQVYLHYSNNAANIIGSGMGTWQQCTFDLMQRYDFLYNAVMSISASHLARTMCRDNASPSAYTNLAITHLSTAATNATGLLPQMSVDGYEPVYIASIIACLATLARGPSQGDLFVVTSDGKAPWLTLLGAVRSVLQNKPAESAGFSCRIPWGDPGAGIGARGTFGTAAIYEDELNLTCASYRMAQRRDPRATSENCRFMIVIGWGYRLSDVFIKGLEGRDGPALLILRHFALIIGLLETEYWWLEGWSSHLLHEINSLMEPRDGDM